MAADDLYQAWVALSQTALTLERALAVRLRPWRLSKSEAIVLLVLVRHGPQRASDLGHVFVHSPQTMTSLIDRMERRSLVQRQHWHAPDRRVVLIALTDAGHARANDISATVWSTIAEAFADASATDLTAMMETLRRVRAVGATLANIPGEHLDDATERLAIAPTDAG